MEPSPKSLILDLLSTLGRQAAPVRALVAAAGLFAISENSLRVALARLCSEGRVERDARGRYRLGPQSRAVSARLRSWRRVEERLRPWGGDWIGVHTGGLGRGTPRARRTRERALRFLGFRTLEPGLELRPDNLADGVGGARAELAALGLEPEAPVFRLADLDEAGAQRARSLWDADALLTSYRDTIAALEASTARLPGLTAEAARAECFATGGAAIRLIVLDPLLPEPILPGGPRRALVEATRRYDRLGRAVWAGWLGAAELEPEALPAGVFGGGAAADALRAVEGV